MNQPGFINSLDLSSLILIVTVIVSIVTSVMSVLTMAFQRSHNVKIVRPFCNIRKTEKDKTLELSIMNAGLGPMFVKNVSLVKSDGKTADILRLGGKNQEELKKRQHPFSGEYISLCDVLPVDLRYGTFINKDDVYVLESMGEMKIFSISERNEKDLEEIKNILNQYIIYIEFCDIYENRYCKTDNLIY